MSDTKGDAGRPGGVIRVSVRWPETSADWSGMKRMLKRMARSYGLKCVDLEIVERPAFEVTG